MPCTNLTLRPSENQPQDAVPADPVPANPMPAGGPEREAPPGQRRATQSRGARCGGCSRACTTAAYRSFAAAGTRIAPGGHWPFPAQQGAFDGQALGWRLADEVLEVTLHREPCNEIGTTLVDELEALVEYLVCGDHGARALIFQSSVPKGFCAGADLRELHQGLQGSDFESASGRWLVAGKVRHFLDRIHRVFNALDRTPITTICAVHGFCFGGGFELALTADVIVADKSARFCFPELRLGLIPGFGGIPRLRRELGNGVVRDLLLTGRSLSAKRAHEVGLVSQLVGRGKALEVSRQVAQQARRFDETTTRAAKSFAKPFPKRELDEEKALFIELLGKPAVRAALADFAQRDDPHAYPATRARANRRPG